MEDKVDTNNFEHFLRDTTDDFLMVPSRRVWYGIYNDIHPDRKWPSMAVCLLILSAVLYIGVSNNNSLSNAARRTAYENLSDQAKNYVTVVNADPSDKAFLRSQNMQPQFYADNANLNKIPLSKRDNANLLSDFLKGENLSGITPAEPNATTVLPEEETEAKNELAVTSPISISAKITYRNNENLRLSLTGSEKNKISTENVITSTGIESESEKSLPSAAAPIAGAEMKTGTAKTDLKIATESERSWQEDFAFRNKPAMIKFRDRASITYFVTPSLGFRQFTKNRESEILVASSSLLPNSTSASVTKDELKDGMALNLELGAVLNYELSGNIRIKSGIQANYTNYISHVTALGHPTQAALAVNNGLAMRSSVYSSTPGPERLNKSSLQISMPIGADFKIAGNHKINWYIGASVQPGYIYSGSAYVLSADEKNYISEVSLLRKWNMNTAAETFVSFRPSPGVTLTAGPQFRYQLLSSFKKEYNYSEKLFNTGIKVGLTTRF